MSTLTATVNVNYDKKTWLNENMREASGLEQYETFRAEEVKLNKVE